MLVSTESWSPPALDEAVSAAVLERVDAGEAPATLRVFVPGRAVVFGRQDQSRPGFAAASRAAADAGFAPVLRLAGGRAAVFHEGTVAISLAIPDPSPRDTITWRFEVLSSAVVEVVEGLGAPAGVGEVPGEYCPGGYSVNLAGKRKIAGLGQRLTRRAAHVGGVVVVEGADEINRVLEPVYRHLGYTWDPLTTGAVDQSVAVTAPEVAVRLADSISRRWPDPHRGSIDEATVSVARSLAGSYDMSIA